MPKTHLIDSELSLNFVIELTLVGLIELILTYFG